METWRWLESTDKLQRETYGYGREYESVHEGEWVALSRYLDWNLTAAVQELAEVREEFSWKPWAKDEPFVNRVRVREEIIDALHFLGNMLTVMGVTDKELAEAYQKKQEINRARAASGTYSARKGGLAQGSDIT
jgi:dimeric dUTPase (all-alpha-NTP-PPase superfamily)